MSEAEQRERQPGLYVHTPFCRTKCPYCGFYSVTSERLIPDFLEALRREARLYEGKFDTFGSLYLGGGTPSLLDDAQLLDLMNALDGSFTFSADAERTIEANPDDITPRKLDALLELGFNRISVGVQSFSDRELRFLGRRHTAAQAEKVIGWIRSSGFTNLALDLMYGLESQTESRWRASLDRAVQFRPEHISCYQMTVEDGTPFAKLEAAHRLSLPNEEEEGSLFLLTSRVLRKNGYIHYEVSNFARSEALVSHHNSRYWDHTPYLGLGPSAHSFQDGARWWNFRSLDTYCSKLLEGKAPIEEIEHLSRGELQFESLFLGLRTRDGIDLEQVQHIPALQSILQQLQRSRLIKVEGGRIIPTQEGFLVADSLPLMFS